MIDYSHLNENELKQLMAECYISTKLFGQVFFPDKFFLPFSPKIHDKMFEIIENPTITKACIIAPRGCGKTTIMDELCPAKDILYQDSKFMTIITNSSTEAVGHGENLKAELESNELVQKLFGKIASGKWAEKRWITNSGTMVLPRGKGQQVRGIKHLDYRPSRIYVDDLEDGEIVRSPDRMADLKSWFFADVMKSVDRHRKRDVIWQGQEITVPNYKVIVTGTLLSHNSLLAQLEQASDWHSIRLELCNKYYQSNWPELVTDEEIMEEVESHKEKEIMDVFLREYRGLAIDDETRKFAEKFVVYYNKGARLGDGVPVPNEDNTEELNKYLAARTSDHELYKNHNLVSFVLIDPAREDKASSNDTAIVGASFDLLKSLLLVRRLEYGKFTPDDYLDISMNMIRDIRAIILGVEVTGAGKPLEYMFKERMLKEHLMIHFEPLKTGNRSKADRAGALLAWFRKYLIWFNSECCVPLVEDLMQFPVPQDWDKIDALAYAPDILMSSEFYARQTSLMISNPLTMRRWEQAKMDEVMNQKSQLEEVDLSIRKQWEL